MKGLLLKDWYMTLRHYRFVLPVCFIFCLLSVLGSEFPLFYAYPPVLLSGVSFSCFAYDEKDGWLGYYGTLPLKRSAYVSAKYLFSLFFVGAYFLLTVALNLLAGLLLENVSWRENMYIATQSVLIGLLLPSLLLPPVLRFGAEKGRLVHLIMIGAICGSYFAVFPRIVAFDSIIWLWSWLLSGVALLYAASWLLSIRLFRNRDITK